MGRVDTKHVICCVGSHIWLGGGLIQIASYLRRNRLQIQTQTARNELAACFQLFWAGRHASNLTKCKKAKKKKKLKISSDVPFKRKQFSLPLSHRSPPQFFSQVQVQGFTQVPCTQPGYGKHSSHSGPCQPYLHLQNPNRAWAWAMMCVCVCVCVCARFCTNLPELNLYHWTHLSNSS